MNEASFCGGTIDGYRFHVKHFRKDFMETVAKVRNDMPGHNKNQPFLAFFRFLC